MNDLIFSAQVTTEKYWYKYFNGFLIYKKPLTARYSCSIDVELLIAEKKTKDFYNRGLKNIEDVVIFDKALTKDEISDIKGVR